MGLLVLGDLLLGGCRGFLVLYGQACDSRVDLGERNRHD